MEEIEVKEVGVERAHEEAIERAREAEPQSPWLRWLALGTAIFAVLAAIASLRSGQFANEALLMANDATLKQAQASDGWAYYQAKSIKQTTLEAEARILETDRAPGNVISGVHAEASKLKSEQDELQREARRLQDEQRGLSEASRRQLERHHRFAYAVTLLQVAIGISAVAALTSRRVVWYVSLAAGVIGVALFMRGLLG